MKQFTFYWLDGKRDVLSGRDAADAMNRAGYGHGALGALDFHAWGDCKEYVWNPKTRRWDNPGLNERLDRETLIPKE